MQSTIKDSGVSQKEISVIVPAEDFLKFEDAALATLNEKYEIPGFRKGKASKDAIIKHAGDMALLEEMAELALSDAYRKVIEEHKLDPIGQPKVTITKIARGNPLEFSLVTAVVPEVALPDYKTIAKEEMVKEYKVEVTDEDIEKTILEIRKMRAHQELHSEHNSDSAEASPDEHDHGDALEEKNLPVVDDEFVKKLGKFENVADFKTKIKENITLEKEREAKNKQRTALLDALIAGTKTDVPEIMIVAEQEKMFARMSHDIEQAGLKIDEYLTHLKKTKQEIMDGWKDDAKKNATLELVIDKVAAQENLKPSPTDVKKQAEELTASYPGSDPVRAYAYIEHMLTTQSVIKFLEEQK